MIDCEGFVPSVPCPVESQTQQLLQEFRAFRDTEWRTHRDQVSQWREEDRARIVALEVKSKDISGNGQPGRMRDVESRTTVLERAFWSVSGALAAADMYLAMLSHGFFGGK